MALQFQCIELIPFEPVEFTDIHNAIWFLWEELQSDIWLNHDNLYQNEDGYYVISMSIAAESAVMLERCFQGVEKYLPGIARSDRTPEPAEQSMRYIGNTALVDLSADWRRYARLNRELRHRG